MTARYVVAVKLTSVRFEDRLRNISQLGKSISEPEFDRAETEEIGGGVEQDIASHTL